MSSVTIEDHGDKKTGLKIESDGRARVAAKITEIESEVLVDVRNVVETNLANGLVFSVRRLSESVADKGYHQLLLYTGTSGAADGGFDSAQAALVINVANGGNAELEIYEDTTCTTSGTQLEIFNKDRASAVVPKSTAFHTPTVTASGTRIAHRLVPEGCGEATEGDMWKDAPIVLKAATNHLISVKNRAGSAKDNSIAVTWIEAS